MLSKFLHLGSPGGSDGEESACSAGDLGLIPGLGRSPGGGHGTSCQYSCLKNPVDRGAWQATVHGVTQSRTRLSDSAQHSHKGVVSGSTVGKSRSLSPKLSLSASPLLFVAGQS